MKAIGIRDLKAHLSEYVRLAKAGETVLVTERDEVVAELRPARRREPPADTMNEVLDALADAGELTRARLRKRGWAWKVEGLGLPAGCAQDLLDQVRSDRHR